MAWTGTVTNKLLQDGVVYVTVEYTDGQNVISETYRNNNPVDEWIDNTVRSRTAQLQIASDYDVPIGPVTPPDLPAVDPNIRLFRSRCRLLEVVKVMIDLGAVDADHPKVLALINWIRNNANDYFDYLEK